MKHPSILPPCDDREYTLSTLNNKEHYEFVYCYIMFRFKYIHNEPSLFKHERLQEKHDVTRQYKNACVSGVGFQQGTVCPARTALGRR